MFLINQAGNELDPLEREEIEAMITEGELNRDDWVWDEITAAWVPLHELFPENFPSFGAAISENIDDSDQPTAAVPPADPLSIQRFTKDGQRPKIVSVILKTIGELMEPDEKLLEVVTQRKPMPDFSPEAMALTNERLFIFEKGHFKTIFDEIPLGGILHPVLHKGLFYTHIHMNAGAGIPYGVKFIPKKQGLVFYKRLETEIARVREAHRNAMGVTRASTGPVVSPLTRANHTPHNPQATPDPEPDEHIALHHLEDLKQMLDEGLITEQDYEIKKQIILKNEL